MRRARGLVGALALPLVLAACGGDGGGAVAGDGGDAGQTSDATGDVVFMGNTSTGVIPRGPGLDAGAIDYSPLDPDALPGCCSMLLTLPDPTGDEAWARIKGDLGALKGDGVAATWADGAWSATVCLQAGLVTKYHFELPSAGDDAAAPGAVGGTDAGVDGGGPPQTVWRVNEDKMTGFDDDANEVNVAVVSVTCGPGDDAGTD